MYIAKLRPRSSNNEAKVYERADGYFHGRLLMGVKEDGSEDRRHVMYRDEADAIREVRKLEKQRDAGLVAKAGRVPTVAEWMRLWLDTSAPRTVQQPTVDEIYWP